MKRKNFERNKRVRRRYLDLQYRLDNGLLKEDEVFGLVRENRTGRLSIIKAYTIAAYEITTSINFWDTHKVIDVYPNNYVIIPADVCYGSGAIAIDKEDFKYMLLAQYRRF